jgi:hypothetical protein
MNGFAKQRLQRQCPRQPGLGIEHPWEVAQLMRQTQPPLRGGRGELGTQTIPGPTRRSLCPHPFLNDLRPPARPDKESGRNGVLKSVSPISNIDTEGVERADVHGIRVRLK